MRAQIGRASEHGDCLTATCERKRIFSCVRSHVAPTLVLLSDMKETSYFGWFRDWMLRTDYKALVSEVFFEGIKDPGSKVIQ